MDLSQRIGVIIDENKLKQKGLAAQMGVSESYISAILAGRKINLSLALAKLIEERYGYSTQWILNGEEPKLKQVSKNQSLSDIHKKAIMHVEKMNDEQIKAVLAFMNSLDEVEKSLKN